eukprot:1366323-Prorocentrum_lima.AAC.1
MEAIQELAEVKECWAVMEKGVEWIVQRYSVERWAMSMEVSPETWEEGQLRLHLHLSLQRINGGM